MKKILIIFSVIVLIICIIAGIWFYSFYNGDGIYRVYISHLQFVPGREIVPGIDDDYRGIVGFQHNVMDGSIFCLIQKKEEGEWKCDKLYRTASNDIMEVFIDDYNNHEVIDLNAYNRLIESGRIREVDKKEMLATVWGLLEFIFDGPDLAVDTEIEECFRRAEYISEDYESIKKSWTISLPESALFDE